MGQGVLTASRGAVGHPAADAPRRRRWRPRLFQFLTFGAPGVAVYVCFVLAPIVISAGYSLTNANPFNPPTRWVGLRNYRLLLTDTEFLIRNSVSVNSRR